MPKHYVLCIRDEADFWSSSKHSIHAVRSKPTIMAGLEELTAEDLIWYMNSKTKQLVAVAAYLKHEKRKLDGPLFPETLTNEELGLSPTNKSDYEIHYNMLCPLREYNLFTERKEKSSLWQDELNELESVYENLIRFSRASFKGSVIPVANPKTVVTFDEETKSASSSATEAEELVYIRKDHCRSITDSSGPFIQSHARFGSDAEAEMYARENSLRYFMRCKLTEGGTYWFLPDKVRRQESKVASDPSQSAYTCVSWERR
jgi:hypothetical protein